MIRLRRLIKGTRLSSGKQGSQVLPGDSRLALEPTKSVIMPLLLELAGEARSCHYFFTTLPM